MVGGSSTAGVGRGGLGVGGRGGSRRRRVRFGDGCSSSRIGGNRLGAEEIGEQRPVVHQRQPQVLRARGAALVAFADLVRVAVVLQRVGWLDGQGGEPLVVLAGRVPALGDEPGDQVVGGSD